MVNDIFTSVAAEQRANKVLTDMRLQPTVKATQELLRLTGKIDPMLLSKALLQMTENQDQALKKYAGLVTFPGALSQAACATVSLHVAMERERIMNYKQINKAVEINSKGYSQMFHLDVS